MTLTQLDMVTALISIDLQKGIVAVPLAHPAHEIVARVAQLAKAFRKFGHPVVLVNVSDRAPGRTDAKSNFNPSADWSELVPELDRQPGDHLVTKLQVGAFYGTSLELFLRRRAVTQIVLAGISTSMGVEATARCAYDHGYHVVLVTDAMTDRDADAHRHSTEQVFPKLGQTTTTDVVLDLLQKSRR